LRSCKLWQWMSILRFNLLDEEDIQLWKCLPQQGDWYLKWQNQITNLSFVSTKCLYDDSWLAKYYSPPSSWRKTKRLPVSNKVSLIQVKLLFGPRIIQLVWHLLKQLFTSGQCPWKWWIFILPLCGSVNIHHYSPPLWWIIVNY